MDSSSQFLPGKSSTISRPIKPTLNLRLPLGPSVLDQKWIIKTVKAVASPNLGIHEDHPTLTDPHQLAFAPSPTQMRNPSTILTEQDTPLLPTNPLSAPMKHFLAYLNVGSSPPCASESPLISRTMASPRRPPHKGPRPHPFSSLGSEGQV
jgi:hypothetical protein